MQGSLQGATRMTPDLRSVGVQPFRSRLQSQAVIRWPLVVISPLSDLPTELSIRFEDLPYEKNDYLYTAYDRRHPKLSCLARQFQ